MNEESVERMHHPEDTLAKRQSAYAAEIKHKYCGFPGEYDGQCLNEYPDAGGTVPRVDSAYYIVLDDERYVMNVEDETDKVDENTLKKIDKYRKGLEYASKLSVISSITTTVPIDKCKKSYLPSPTLELTPIIISWPEYDGEQILSMITDKINDEKILSNVEAMNLVMIPRMFKENNSEVLEKVCFLLQNLKIEDEEFHLELIFEMDCMIHKYAETLDDIKRLEEVIGLRKAMTSREYQNKLIFEKGESQGRSQGLSQGLSQGISQGEFSMALKIKEALGIDEAVRISGFSKEELLNGKLSK